MAAFETPEAAVLADSVPPEYVRVVAVGHSPDGSRAVVFVEYNEPPRVEPYQVLCEKAAGGWTAGNGGSGGGATWTWTHDDPERGPCGVLTWEPPTAVWNVPEIAPRGDPGAVEW